MNLEGLGWNSYGLSVGSPDISLENGHLDRRLAGLHSCSGYKKDSPKKVACIVHGVFPNSSLFQHLISSY